MEIFQQYGKIFGDYTVVSLSLPSDRYTPNPSDYIKITITMNTLHFPPPITPTALR